ncbi:hypothetical protein MPTK1_3g07480 [Marchantia polymorpha subsp. ruderalis]|uniref:Altered inheritance of mitochondria protein 24, mitochondrial n=2 Tax=Marchantia polymorpha TaxID=3197 RepID=A0AAF6AYD4_MARPO|nr:hypothetical protein MARPO_0006s0223 [Marchantia polymorpha]BBN04768.1 hypothetical protein Mp_3g07480 [Marchantia polymorpha subsp. ruderalis]|eukprot:PTQ48216.1 hypothetical protein MARPO_0006s0223 [Marchantia polymorpha]
MAAPALSTPFQPYVYQSPQAVVTPFQILGGEAQVLQIMLKPQEKVTARTGSMCYMSDAVQTETNVPAENAGNVIWQWLFGKVDAISTYVNNGTQDGYIGLGAPSLARVLPIDLAVFGEEIICQRDSFLCSINDVSVSPVATRRARPGMFGGEGFMMQKLVGRGLAFITAGGSIIQKHLARGEVLVVDAGCLVAMTTSVELELKYAGPLKRAFFGGENLLHAHLTGPGVVFVQSLPFFRLAQKIARAVTAPHVRDNPRFFLQIAIIFFVAYVMVISSLVLTEQ